jgi:hypothetical protein
VLQGNKLRIVRWFKIHADAEKDERTMLSEENGIEGTQPRKCPDCGAAMAVVRVVPKAATFPELNTLRCSQCGHVMTIEVKG